MQRGSKKRIIIMHIILIIVNILDWRSATLNILRRLLILNKMLLVLI